MMWMGQPSWWAAQRHPDHADAYGQIVREAAVRPAPDANRRQQDRHPGCKPRNSRLPWRQKLPCGRTEHQGEGRASAHGSHRPVPGRKAENVQAVYFHSNPRMEAQVLAGSPQGHQRAGHRGQRHPSPARQLRRESVRWPGGRRRIRGQCVSGTVRGARPQPPSVTGSYVSYL